ncbi:MAG: flagellar FlbD family protein [Clostridiales bacterium]|nr:flagellar FlbD family protein [Clostridiales bacterium]
MIEVTNLNGKKFIVNAALIEKIENIPETKITLATGKYLLVAESMEEVSKKIVQYNRRFFQNSIVVCKNEEKPQEN